MKRFIAVFLSLCAVVALTSCNNAAADTPETGGSSDSSGSSGSESPTEESKDTVWEVPEVDRVLDYEIDPTKPVIALTFDDGPNTTTTNQILDLLQKYQVRASFFLIGDNINDDSAEVVKRAYDMGCEINNHSKTHSYMNEMSAEDIAAEVKYVSDKVEEITGQPTAFFRPPYIAVNDTMYENIDMPFISGMGCDDWNPQISTEARIKRVQRMAKDGLIVLLHDAAGNDQTVEALDTLIPYLLEKGYQFVTVTELFEVRGVPISGEDTELYSLLEPAQ